MANILIEKDGKIEYLKSVNTGDYVLDPNVSKDQVVPKEGVLINPDTSQVEGIDTKYWKLDKGEIVEMTKDEKDAVDLIEKQKQDEAKDTFESLDVKTLADALVKKGVITKEEIYG